MSVFSLADAKSHLRVFHAEDDAYITTLITVVQEEWEQVTRMRFGAHLVSRRYDLEPDDGYFRFDLYPVNTATATWTEDNGSPVTLTASNFRTLEYLSIYDAREEIDLGTIAFPGTLAYSTSMAVASVPVSIQQALKLRLAYYYAYRGDDPTPPDCDGYNILAARWRTGAIL